jgi:hypothetical protein
MKLIIFILLSTLLSSFCTSQDTNSHIIETCNDDGTSCDVALYHGSEIKKIILKEYPFSSKIEDLPNDISIIYSSCGSSCSIYTFVDKQSEQVERIENPLIYSKEFGLVVSIIKNEIIIKKPFSKKIQKFNINNLAATGNPVNAIDSLYFNNKNSLKVYYLDSNFSSKNITINID